MTAVQWTQAQRESPVSSRAAQVKERSTPVRTCIGCRKRALAADLMRVVVQASASSEQNLAVVPDPRRRLPGRGAWLHPTSACLSQAVRRRAFGRALRVSGNLDISALEQDVENRHEHS
ncbi:YlxR family protein [Nocardia sp. 2]|uniref:YlxR family protein n=1 Tax=Nocardia acididurans TaxID=2802282 RepID=A0ABS1MDK8_9NOCA|nr:YlxR family protein [Nocardia acididurans]